MKKEELAGTVVVHNVYGSGVITGFEKGNVNEQVFIAFDKDNIKRRFEFPDTLLNERYFKLDKETRERIISVYICSEDGRRIERAELEQIEYSCFDCGKERKRREHA